jgi:N-acetylmuramic acid 6-phosphate etherase
LKKIADWEEMIDLKPTNIKLQIRARRILRGICGNRCPVSDDELDAVLREADNSVKLAATKLLMNVSMEEARHELERNGGVLAEVVEGFETITRMIHERANNRPQQAVLCIDGGGSKCRAVIVDRHGCEWIGEAGPCNPSDMGVDGATAAVELAVRRAMDSSPVLKHLKVTDVEFLRRCFGLAGVDREPMRSQIRLELERLLGRNSSRPITVNTDLELLATIAGEKFDARDVLVLIAGTGSIAMRFRKEGNRFKRVARAGGWGALLGDEGSGFDIGRSAIRLALECAENPASDNENVPSVDPLIGIIERHFQPTGGSSTLVDRVRSYFRSSQDTASDWSLLDAVLSGKISSPRTAAQTKQRIAACAKVVLASIDVSEEARNIVDSALLQLANLVRKVSVKESEASESSVLVLAGGLMQDAGFREALQAKLKDDGIYNGHVETMGDLASTGAHFLAKQASNANEWD